MKDSCKLARELVCRMHLFLYNTSTKEMMGVFKAVSYGDTHDEYGRDWVWLLLAISISRLGAAMGV